MPPDRPAPGSAADWMRRARSDLALAGITLPPDVLYSELCFHAQQAVEKSIKAVLIHCVIEFPKAHDIGYLMTLLPQEIALPPGAEEIVGLTGYAVMFRYPGDYADVAEEDYQWALQAAHTVYTWAVEIIWTSGSDERCP